MKKYEYPGRELWPEIVKRPQMDVSRLNAVVAEVLAEVLERGDAAVMDYEERFDHVRLSQLAVTDAEIDEAVRSLDPALMDAIRLAHSNIQRFHEAQRFAGIEVETAPGVRCWQRSVPIERVGLYIPGGTAPLFSTVLMLATPARIAGCSEIVLCSPPDRQGRLHPAILAAASIAGVNRIYKAGGVQAIGAMAYGTQTVPRVYKIFGPGNQYVMAAKQQVSQQQCAIDMPAGPSEVCVVADHTCNPRFVAADLLSQAEHGTDSQVLLITTSRDVLRQVTDEVQQQLSLLPRRELAEQTLQNSKFVLVADTNEAMALSNAYAPEHLILATENYDELANQVVNAGSVFLGNYACESAGDYASGTNHTLPTHGHAVAYGGVCLDSFMRKVTFQHLSPQGIRSIGKAVELMAEAEQLQAHRNAMTLRIKEIEDTDAQ